MFQLLHLFDTGIGGFMARIRHQRAGRTPFDEADFDTEIGPDGKPKKKRRGIRKRSELENAYPDYIQVGSFIKSFRTPVFLLILKCRRIEGFDSIPKNFKAYSIPLS